MYYNITFLTFFRAITDGKEINLKNEIEILTYEWTINRKRLHRNQNGALISDPYCFESYQLFIAILHQKAQQGKGFWTQKQTLKLLCPIQSEIEVDKIYCYNNRFYPHTWISMNLTNHGGVIGPFKIFQISINPGLKSPFSLRFQLQIKRKVEGLASYMIDKKWFTQMGYCRREQGFVDVTITNSREQTLKAHRFVLSSRSPVFASFLNKSLDSQTIANINLGDVSVRVMECFLYFLYTGQLICCTNDRAQLKFLADMYEIDSLQKCLSIPADSCNTDNLLLSALAV